MEAKYFFSFTGTIIAIYNFHETVGMKRGCSKIFSVEGEDGNLVNFVITPATYSVHMKNFSVGDRIIAFYDANAPAILIYPPQFNALVISEASQTENVKVDWFGRDLVSADGSLKLNITDQTEILLENGQSYEGSLVGRKLIVIYGSTTRSIPAITSPVQVIVLCR
jgi:hypothetical protein